MKIYYLAIVRWLSPFGRTPTTVPVILINASTFRDPVNQSAFAFPPLWRSLPRFASWEARLSCLRFVMRDEIFGNGFHSAEVIDPALGNWDGDLASRAGREPRCVIRCLREVCDCQFPLGGERGGGRYDKMKLDTIPSVSLTNKNTQTVEYRLTALLFIRDVKDGKGAFGTMRVYVSSLCTVTIGHKTNTDQYWGFISAWRNLLAKTV